MNITIQVNHSRMIQSSVPDAVNRFDPACADGLPSFVVPLLPIFYEEFCRRPYSPNKFISFDNEETRPRMLDLFNFNMGTLTNTDQLTAIARWRALTKARKDILAFRILNAFGSVYGWTLHRVLRACRRNVSALQAQRWRPVWPINQANVDGQPPLISAVRFACVRLVAHLLEQGADVEAQDFHGAPLHWAASAADCGETRSILDFLLEAGANVHARTKRMVTPLHAAAARGNAAAVRALLDHGADPYALDLEGQLPLSRLDPYLREEDRRAVENAFSEAEARKLDSALVPAPPVPAPSRQRL